MQLIQTLNRYYKLYAQLLSFSFKSVMEYRLNFVVQMLYGPSYMFVLFLLVLVAYSKAPSLAGWSREEGILLCFVFQLIYVLSSFLFIHGVRRLLWEDIRLGKFDFILTKPVNTQFLATFSKPQIEFLGLLFGLMILLGRQLWIVRMSVTPAGLAGGIFLSFIGVLTIYFSVTSYATLGFYVTRAQQVLEFFDKVSDSAQYPLHIFPFSFQLFAFTLVPTAYFSYVPASFFLGRGSSTLFALSILFLAISSILNQFLWKKAVRQYASASS